MDTDWNYFAQHWILVVVPYFVTTVLPVIFVKWGSRAPWRELLASWGICDGLLALMLMNADRDPDQGTLIVAAAVLGLYKMFLLPIVAFLIALSCRRREVRSSA